jgi:hypothetical protein
MINFHTIQQHFVNDPRKEGKWKSDDITEPCFCNSATVDAQQLCGSYAGRNTLWVRRPGVKVGCLNGNREMNALRSPATENVRCCQTRGGTATWICVREWAELSEVIDRCWKVERRDCAPMFIFSRHQRISR